MAHGLWLGILLTTVLSILLLARRRPFAKHPALARPWLVDEPGPVRRRRTRPPRGARRLHQRRAAQVKQLGKELDEARMRLDMLAQPSEADPAHPRSGIT